MADLKHVQGKAFGPGETVEIDGHAFVGCAFDGCTVVYSGGMFGMGNTNVFGTVNVELRDAAARTGSFLKWFRIDIRQYGDPGETVDVSVQ